MSASERVPAGDQGNPAESQTQTPATGAGGTGTESSLRTESGPQTFSQQITLNLVLDYVDLVVYSPEIFLHYDNEVLAHWAHLLANTKLNHEFEQSCFTQFCVQRNVMTEAVI